MPKKIPLNLCLLFGLLFAFPAQAATPAIAKLGIADTMLQLAVEPTPAASTITLKDLPPGFRELPPEISAALSSRLDLLNQKTFLPSLTPKISKSSLGLPTKSPLSPSRQASTLVCSSSLNQKFRSRC